MTPASTSRSSAATRCFWKTRWEPSIDGSDTPYRTLVCYKETHANAKIDPLTALDGHLARPALQPASRRRPPGERAHRHDLHGERHPQRRDQVPAADGKMRFWRNTSVATLAAGPGATLPAGIARLRVGRGPRQRLPASRPRPPVDDDRLRRRSTCRTTARPTRRDRDAPPHALPARRAARSCSAPGTVQWSWGLDAVPRPRRHAATDADAAGDGQPVRRHGRAAGDAAAGARRRHGVDRHDRAASTITSPARGAPSRAARRDRHRNGERHGGGRVGGVEVSTDGGPPGIPPSDGIVDLRLAAHRGRLHVAPRPGGG